MKKFILILFILGITLNSYADEQITQSAVVSIAEEDGTPTAYPWQVKVTNGTLTDNGDGTVSLTTGGGAGGGAPTDATYITQTANGTLSAEQALSTLSTGLMQVTTTTGAITSVTTSAGVSGLLSDETGTGTAVFNNSPTFADDIQLGLAGVSGQLKLYSEQGATDYTATINPNASMASDANFYLPADEPVGTYFLKVGSTGIMTYDSATYLITEVDGSITNELPIAGNLIDISGSPASTVDVDLTEAEAVTWGAGAAATIVHTYNVSGTDTTMTMGSAMTTFSGDLTITGDDLFMTTNTSGAVLVADGTNYNPVVMSGDASIGTTGIISVHDTRLEVRNETGSTLAVGKAVYISGFNNIPLLTLSDNTVAGKELVIGVVEVAIGHEANGYIKTNGTVSMNTDSMSAVGARVYLSTSGTLTTTKPTSGVFTIVGIVTIKSTSGEIELTKRILPSDICTASAVDVVVRMGDSIGVNKISFKDYANNEVAYINSDGAIFSSGTFDAIGAVGLVLGSADITSFTVTTDGTGNAELTLPADSIGDADIDWGTGAGQVGVADIADAAPLASPTFTGTVTVPNTAFISGQKFSKSFVITNATAAADGSVWRCPVAATITAVHLLCKGGTVTGQLQEQDANGLNDVTIDASDITGVTNTNVNDDGSLSNPSIDAGDYIGWITTSITGTNTKTIITWEGYYN